MKKIQIPQIAFYAALVVAVLILVLSTAFSSVQNVSLNSEKLTEFNENWKISVDNRDLGVFALPMKLDVEGNRIVTLTNTLPEELRQNSTLFFRTSQSFVRVRVDGKLLSSFGYDSDLMFGSVEGSAWQVIRIPPESFGKPISIQIQSPYHKYSGKLGPIYIGTKAAIIYNIIEHSYFKVLLSFLILLAGVVLLILYALVRKLLQNTSWLHLGTFSVLLGLWSLGESKAMQLFVGNSYLVTNMVFLALLLLPVPFYLFLESFACFKGDKFVRGFSVLTLVNFAVCTVLQLCHLADYFSVLFMIHTVIISSSAYIIAKFSIYLWHKRDQETIVLASGTITLAVLSMLDVFLFYRFEEQVDPIFSHIGFLLFVLIVGTWVGRQAIVHYSHRIEEETLRSLAYTDSLTKLGNRAAFEAHMDLYRNGEITDRATIAIFDVNNLKATNDTLGHYYGDKLITDAAHKIEEAFQDVGKCFRIGGDEFCAICTVLSDEQMAQRLQPFHVESGHAGNDLHTLSIAHGFAHYSPEEGDTIDSALVRADWSMYNCKGCMKTAAVR